MGLNVDFVYEPGEWVWLRPAQAKALISICGVDHFKMNIYQLRYWSGPSVHTHWAYEGEIEPLMGQEAEQDQMVRAQKEMMEGIKKQMDEGEA